MFTQIMLLLCTCDVNFFLSSFSRFVCSSSCSQFSYVLCSLNTAMRTCHAAYPPTKAQLWVTIWVSSAREWVSLDGQGRTCDTKKMENNHVLGGGRWWVGGLTGWPQNMSGAFCHYVQTVGALRCGRASSLSLSPFGSGYVCSLVHKTKSSRENMSRRVGRSEQQENKASWILFVLPHPPAANAALCSFRDVLLLLCCCCSYVYRTLCGAIAAVKCDLASSSSKGTHARCRAKRTEWTNGLGLVLGYWFYHHVPRL